MLITSDFFDSRPGRERHDGTDFNSVQGQPICAAISGYVEFNNSGSIPKMLIRDYDNHIAIRYLDANTDLVKPGSFVQKGQPLFNQQRYHGTGWHLHLDAIDTRDGNHLDSMFFLSQFPHEYAAGFNNAKTRVKNWTPVDYFDIN